MSKIVFVVVIITQKENVRSYARASNDKVSYKSTQMALVSRKPTLLSHFSSPQASIRSKLRRKTQLTDERERERFFEFFIFNYCDSFIFLLIVICPLESG